MINIKTLTHTHILDIEINYTSVYLNCTENVNERIIDEHRKKRKTLQLKIDKTENLIYFYINLIKKKKMIPNIKILINKNILNAKIKVSV